MLRIYSKVKKNELFIIGYLSVFIIILTFITAALIVGVKGNDGNSYEFDEGVVEKKTLDSDVKVDFNNKVRVYLTKESREVELDVEEYICGVVASEMPAEFEIEALKAQAIAARTYFMNKKIRKCNDAKGADICDTTHCQVYIDKAKKNSEWGEGGEEYWNKINKAVAETKDKVITYNEKIIEYPQFFAISSGMTENCKDVFSGDEPYLVSVESKGEEVAPKYKSEIKQTAQEFINLINKNYSNCELDANKLESNIKILERSEAGGVKKIKVGKAEIKGTDFRKLLNLNSTNFEYELVDGEIIFTCKGYGHGVGMSQWGANIMAKEGNGYEKIIKHYYKGTEIKNVLYK